MKAGVGLAGRGMEGPTMSKSGKMQRLYEKARRAARTGLPILVTGETGSGKEVLARAIHDWSDRSGGPWTPMNCAAIPHELLESLLFGHERGAFTGALRARAGIFETARGGTVFLDEIGELPLSAQAKLLRVLETGSVARVGSFNEVPVGVRVVAATHRDLSHMVREKRFREDLFFRVHVVRVHVPPLRERREEILPLARMFLSATDLGASATFSQAACGRLMEYSWPGNIRELRNAVTYAAAFCDGTVVHETDLPLSPISGGVSSNNVARTELVRNVATEANGGSRVTAGDLGDTGTLKERMARYEADLLRNALRESAGNRTRAAELLGVPVRTFAWKV